jgi:MFS transporter, ACS family, D-galactonate transporter
VAEIPVGSKRTYRSWTTVFLLFWFMVINLADRSALGLAARPIMREFQLNHTQFGLGGMSFFIFFSTSSVLFGLAIARLSSKWTLACMATAWSLCQLLAVLSVSTSGLLLSRILLGLSDGAAYPIALYTAYKWFPNERRAVPTSIIATSGAVGAGFLAPVLSHLIAHSSWRTAFESLAVAGLLWCGLWIVIGRDGPSGADSAKEGNQETQAVSIRALLTARTVVGTQIAGFCAYWLLALSVLWLPTYPASASVSAHKPWDTSSCCPRSVRLSLFRLSMASRNISCDGASAVATRGEV